jgi:hypothetical protein
MSVDGCLGMSQIAVPFYSKIQFWNKERFSFRKHDVQPYATSVSISFHVHKISFIYNASITPYIYPSFLITSSQDSHATYAA